VSWTEVAGFATGALCVWLVVRRNIWNFPVGIANNVFFIVLFVEAGLYGDAGLQVVYIGLGVIGWYWWLHGGIGHTRLTVRPTPSYVWLLAGVAIACLTWLLTAALTAYTDSTVAGWDALTTAMSLTAQFMLNRKWIGTWWVWISADVVYILLYASKGLWLTGALYVLFMCLCVIGLRQWRGELDSAGGRSERATGGRPAYEGTSP
jgi:nicotinamide mononucleotide transporter